jgi:hypothetical protein
VSCVPLRAPLAGGLVLLCTAVQSSLVSKGRPLNRRGGSGRGNVSYPQVVSMDKAVPSVGG